MKAKFVVLFLIGSHAINLFAAVRCDQVTEPSTSTEIRSITKVKFNISEIPFTEKEKPVFIAFEGWGHAYLQVGALRLDGHLMKPVQVVQNANELNRGFYFEIKGLTQQQKTNLEQYIHSRHKTGSVTCVLTILEALNSSVGITFKNLSDPFSLSEFFSNLSSRLTAIPMHTLNAAEFQARLEKIEQKWISGLLLELTEKVPDLKNLAADSLLKWIETSDFKQNYRLTEAQKSKLKEKIKTLEKEGQLKKWVSQLQDYKKRRFDELKIDIEKLATSLIEDFMTTPDANLQRIRPENRVRLRTFNHSNSFEEVPTSKIVDQVLSRLERTNRHGSTLPVNEYIERHIKRGVFEKLLQESGIEIMVLQGSREEAHEFLAERGFSELLYLPRNRVTDFDQAFAIDHQSMKVTYVIRSLPSQSMLQEIISNLFYYSLVIDNQVRSLSSRPIRFYKTNVSPIKNMAKVFIEMGIDPDIVFLSYSTSFQSMIMNLGGQFISQYVTEDITLRLFEYKGKTIISVPIEPELYSDRAGLLIKALSQVSSKRRFVGVVGTSGSTTPDIPHDSYVVPSLFSKANDLDAHSIERTLNRAQNVEKLKTFEFVKIGLKHTSVDSILYEDNSWLLNMRNQKISIVEQEGFYLAKESRSAGYPLFAAYRISDVVGSDQHFVNSEHKLDEDRLKKVQQAIFMTIMELF